MNPLERARNLLLAGDVIAIPTETVYGLAADINSPVGLRKVFSVKERPFFDPLIVHVHSVEKARELSRDWTPVHEVLARACWPGPLTIVTPKASSVDPLITSGLDEVGIRCPRHPMTLELLQSFAGLAAPSANKFGKTSPTTAAHVRAEFGENVMVLDGGPCEVGIESTVIAIGNTDGRRRLLVYRPGFYTALALQDILEDAGLPTEAEYTESPVAPGQLAQHYMPSVPVLVQEGSSDIMTKAEKFLGKKLPRVAHLELGDDPLLAARRFYGELRSLSVGHDAILVKLDKSLTQDENWKALMNRLGKAASFKG